MPTAQDSLLCLNCGKTTLHARGHFSAGIGCFLSLFTCGLFFPIWILIMLIESFQPKRCQACGLPYSDARAKEYYARQEAKRKQWTAAQAAQEPLMALPADEPPFDFSAVLDAVRRFGATSWGEAVKLYRGMPDWLQPIFWALSATGPLAIIAIAGRLKGWW